MIPPISQAAMQAYRDLGHALTALAPLAIVALGISIGIELAALLPRRVSAQPSFTLLAAFVLNVTQSFLLTPYLIAVHRLIILGEVAQGYRLAPGEPRFQQFFGWSLALTLATFVPMFLLPMLTASIMTQTVLTALWVIVVFVVSLRLTIMFPAVAVDAAGATFDNVMADTKGHAGKIFLIGTVAFLPFIIAIFFFYPFAASRTGFSILALAGVVLQAALGVVSLTLFVVIASRIYLWIGNRTKNAAT